MKTNPLNTGVLTSNFAGIGPVTRAMVQARALELAVIAGRAPPSVTQADYEQAKRELTGESDMDRQDAILDSIPEVKRWDPVPLIAPRIQRSASQWPVMKQPVGAPSNEATRSICPPRGSAR